MHAKVKNVEEELHWCKTCDYIHQGWCAEDGVYEDDLARGSWVSAEDYDEEAAESFFGNSVTYKTLYGCNNGHTTLKEDEIFDLQHVWVCGSCGSQYLDKEKAGDCCL